MTPVALLPKIRSDAIMKSAKDKDCSLRIASFIPGRSCDHGTTIGAHLPVFGKGMSTKVTDLAVVYACYTCHQIIDGEDAAALIYLETKYPAALAQRMLMALVETQARLVEQGILQVPNSRII